MRLLLLAFAAFDVVLMHALQWRWLVAVESNPNDRPELAETDDFLDLNCSNSRSA